MVSVQQKSRLIFSALVLLILLLRSVIPAGFMPAGGLAPLTICTGTGSATIYISPDKIPPSGHEKNSQSHSVCHFSSVFFQGLDIPTANITSIFVYPAPLPFYLSILSASGSPLKSYLSQGPPAL